MTTTTFTDMRSPWYEVFAQPASNWDVAPGSGSPEPPTPSESVEVQWVTQAIFDAYNA